MSSRLGYSERHLNRLITDELGAGPLAIARAQRAQTARVLIETTTMSMTDIAFAAGFTSVRQFNDTVREVFADVADRAAGAAPSPSARSVAAMSITPTSASGSITVRLPVRAPFDPQSVFGFLGARVVPGVESWDGTAYRRIAPAAPRRRRGRAASALTAPCRARCGSTRWPTCRPRCSAAGGCSTSTPIRSPIDRQLGADPLLGPLVAQRPGCARRAASTATELVVRAIIGQQVSVAGAATVAGRLAALVGDGLERLPSAGDESVRAAVPVGGGARRRSIRQRCRCPEPAGDRCVGVCAAIAEGRVDVDLGADRDRAGRCSCSSCRASVRGPRSTS